MKTLLWWILHDVSEGWFKHRFQKNSLHLWFSAPTCPHGKKPKYHTHTHRHTAGKRPISFRSCFSPVFPLHCSSPLLLMIFLIPRKETEVKGHPLISSLWTWSSCGCCCLRPCPLKLAHTRTHTLTCKLTNADILLLPRTDTLAKTSGPLDRFNKIWSRSSF